MDDAQLAKKLYNDQFAAFSEKQTAYPSLRDFRKRVFQYYHEHMAGKRVLFAGCGDGRECQGAVDAGAKAVVGIDVSDVAIDHCRLNCPGAEFQVMDFEKMLFDSKSFDTIFSFFAVMYKEDLQSVLREFRRVLKDAGRIILIVPHPIRKMMKYNENGNYFVKGKRTEVWKGIQRFGYHRLFEDYVEAFAKTNLMLQRLFEHKPLKETPETPDSEINYPHFLLFELRLLPFVC